MNRAFALLAAVTFTAGCTNDTGLYAPASATLNAPSDVTVAWDDSLNAYDDGLGYLHLMQWSVVDETARDGAGLMLSQIRVEFLSGTSGIYLLPETALRQVDAPDNSTSDCTPGSDLYDVRTCPWYDNASQTYVQLSSNYSSEEGENAEDLFRPNYLVAATNERGIVRMWAYIDSLQGSEEGFAEGSVYGSIGHDSATVVIGVVGQ